MTGPTTSACSDHTIRLIVGNHRSFELRCDHAPDDPQWAAFYADVSGCWLRAWVDGVEDLFGVVAIPGDISLSDVRVICTASDGLATVMLEAQRFGLGPQSVGRDPTCFTVRVAEVDVWVSKTPRGWEARVELTGPIGSSPSWMLAVRQALTEFQWDAEKELMADDQITMEQEDIDRFAVIQAAADQMIRLTDIDAPQ